MSYLKNAKSKCAATLIAAGLVAAPFAAATSMAWAEGEEGATAITETSFKIAKSAAINNQVKYKAIQIFEATITDQVLENGEVKENGGMASGFDWANSDVKKALCDAHTDADGNVIPAIIPAEYAKSAQDAATYIREEVNGDLNTSFKDLSDAATILSSSDLGMRIASALSELDGTSLIAGGDAITMSEGYWVVIPDGFTQKLNESGNVIDGEYITENAASSSPIFVVAGQQADIVVKAKTDLPIFTKQIKEDDTNTFGNVASHTLGESIDYELKAVTPENAYAFDKFAYKFVDTLDQHLSLKAAVDQDGIVTSGVTVKAYYDAGTASTTDDVIEKCVVKYDTESRTLTIEIADINRLTTGYAAPRDIVVSYSATISSSTASGDNGFANTASLQFSSNPLTDDMAETTAQTAKDYSFALNVKKIDAANEDPISGIGFAVQKADGKYEGTYLTYLTEEDEGGDDGGYDTSQEQGGIMVLEDEGDEPALEPPLHYTSEMITDAKNAYSFTTASNGMFTLDGIEEGTYKFTEIDSEATNGDKYQSIDPFYVKVAMTKDEQGNVTGKEFKIVDEEGNAVTSGGAASIRDGVVVVENTKNLPGLPITGEQGIMILVLVGGAIVVGSAVMIARGRRKGEDDEQ